jgi:hypothetical protein
VISSKVLHDSQWEEIARFLVGEKHALSDELRELIASDNYFSHILSCPKHPIDKREIISAERAWKTLQDRIQSE